MGADAELANVYGYTPLILSAQFGYEEIAKILLYRDPGTLKHCCTPLSGGDIWIKVLPQKRSTVHIYVCDIWNDLRPFLKYLAQPFSSKLRSKEAKGLKSGNLGK